MLCPTFAFASALFFLLLYSNSVLHVEGVFKLLDQNAKLVSNAQENVVYLFQFPRTSTTPSQAAYNLMVETWLHWKKIKFHRISNQLFLGSFSKGTAPFAYFNSEYIDGSKEIIEKVGSYKLEENEKELMEMILDMFNILMVDRAAGLEWMTTDEALVELIVPQSFPDQKLNVELQGVPNFEVPVDSKFWGAYFDAFNAKEQSAKEAFVKNVLKPSNGSAQLFYKFSDWLRETVISRTMQTVLTKKVGGEANTRNPANSQAKLEIFLQRNSLKSMANKGKTKQISEYSKKEIAKKLEIRWKRMEELVEPNGNKSLYHDKKQTMADAALFGVLVQFFETPLNIKQFKKLSEEKGPLFEFTKNVKESLGLSDEKWAALTERPWKLNFDTDHIFDFEKQQKYDGPYKVEVKGWENIRKCFDFSKASVSQNCFAEYPTEILETAQVLLDSVKGSTEKEAKLRQAKISELVAYLCKENCEKMDQLTPAAQTQSLELGMPDVRRTVFERIIAYNDAKTVEAVLAEIAKVRKAISAGDAEAVAAMVNPPELTNEY